VKYQGIAFQIIENTSKMNFAIFMNKKISSDSETFIKKNSQTQIIFLTNKEAND
jgi:hypothetical protein